MSDRNTCLAAKMFGVKEQDVTKSQRAAARNINFMLAFSNPMKAAK